MARASNAQTRAIHHEQFPARRVQSACLHVTQPRLESDVKVMVSGVNGKRCPGAPGCVGEACRARTTYEKNVLFSYIPFAAGVFLSEQVMRKSRLDACSGRAHDGVTAMRSRCSGG